MGIAGGAPPTGGQGGHNANTNASRDKENVPAYDVKLERVLGVTVSSNSGLDCDSNSEVIAYPAGCTIVFFNILKARQYHLLNTSRKTVTCVAFSPDGHYLVTGECGHIPSVRVWDLTTNSLESEFPGHKYGINCVAFSPSQKYVVSVGSQHDMIVNVWDWRSRAKVASNKVSTKVKAVAFAESGNYFVTVGNRHVKFWYLEYKRSAKYKEPVPLVGRSAILGEQRNNDFCDVACGKGEMGDSTFAITKSGLLCEFNNRRLLDKWVELRTNSANCMAVGERHIFIGCAEGIVRCFNPATLQFITTLPRTHYLGVDVAEGLSISHMANHPTNAKYPDAIALAYDERNQKLSCIYNDHSLYVWDVKDIKRVGKSYSFLYHSACIWAVEMYPAINDQAMPPGSFVTCSSDDTIRFWNLDNLNESNNKTMYRRNIYSNELLKVMYIDPELNYLKNMDLSGAEKGDNMSYDGRNGVRSVRISPDGKHLASGDRAGNIRIHDLISLQQLCLIEAHDAEVLCLEYSQSRSIHDTSDDSSCNFLASASRDRLIHVFDVDQDYNFIQTLDDHSSSITAVRFLNTQNQLQMVSCGADKSIIFRQLQGGQFSRGHNAAGKTTLYDMEVDCMQKHILTACQDRNIRVYSINSGKHTKTFKGSVGEDGSLIKVSLDPSGILVASSCTDKTLCIYDYYSGECLATMLGHSELATGLRFTNDCRRLISASGDGCIFVWKVPHDLVVTMHARLSQQAARAGKKLNGIGIISEADFGSAPEILDPNANTVPTDNDYRFSVGQLPLWAKKQMSVPLSPANPRIVEVPKGRWAQRIHPTGMTVKSVFDSDSIIPFPLSTEKRLDSDGSKEDSSIDSGTETSRSLFTEVKRETIITQKKVIGSKVTVTRGSDNSEMNIFQRNRHHTDDSSLGSFKYEDIESTEHDGDVEDYSEGDSTEPEPRSQLIYYPATHEETNSDYTVNAMDVDELRRSQRRSKIKHGGATDLLLHVGETSQSQSVSGSQESEDDDTAATPTTDRLPICSEAIDLLSHREKFLKNTFESLSGPEMDKEHSPPGKRSISSQHVVGSGPRNSNVIQAARHAKNDADTTRKREELSRRIEETRRKLQSVDPLTIYKIDSSTAYYTLHTPVVKPTSEIPQSAVRGVGYRSNLKSSQSIQDLSPRGTSYHENSWKMQQMHQQSVPPSKVQNKSANLGKLFNSIVESNSLKIQNPHKTSTNITNICNNRPASLNLSSEYSISDINPKPTKASYLSLPESPVYEEVNSSSNLCLTDSETNTRPISQKRYSCTFFVDLKSSYSEEFKNNSKSIESLSEAGKSIDLSIDEKSEDNLSEFSSDSLESCGEFSGSKLPRRCVSEYQIFSKSAHGESEVSKTRFHSEENILSDDDNSAELLNRHSSASFFLRSKKKCQSSESILTDESEYQFLFNNKDKEEFQSTESILTDISDSVSRDFPEKVSVFRTRSLQNTSENVLNSDDNVSKSRPETPFYGTQKGEDRSKPRNECFFILLEGKASGKIPEVLTKRLQSREKKFSLPSEVHPIVTHKPPKPQQKSSARSQRKSWQKPFRESSGRDFFGIKTLTPVVSKDNLENEIPVRDVGMDVSFQESEEQGSFQPVNNRCLPVSNSLPAKLNEYKDLGKQESDSVQTKTEDSPRMPSVKQLSQTFERFSTRNYNSYHDDGDNGRVTAADSESSTPATSSSANSPKRHPHPLYNLASAKRLTNQRLSILPIKCSAVEEESKSSPGIRRACSLSDLANPVPGRQRMMHAGSSQGKGPVRNTRTTTRHTFNKPSSTMTRSSSVGVLNQSDSESDLNHQHSVRNVATMRAMRPTISSQNKVNTSSVGKTPAAVSRRRGISGAYSSLNLSQAVENEDTSSEEGKGGPSPAARTRSSSQDRTNGGTHARRNMPGLGRSGSERDLRTSERQGGRIAGSRVQRSASGMVRSMHSTAEITAVKGAGPTVDVASAPLSQQLISSITDQLMRAADSVVQLHKRLEKESFDDPERENLLGGLEGAVSEAQNTLRLVDAASIRFDESNFDEEATIATTTKLHEALLNNSSSSSADNNSNSDVVSMMQQYSDILVSLVQQRMTKDAKK